MPINHMGNDRESHILFDYRIETHQTLTYPDTLSKYVPYYRLPTGCLLRSRAGGATIIEMLGSAVSKL